MNNNQVQLPLHVLIKRQQVYELIINNVDAHVPTYFLSDIIMLQVDSLWTALHMEGQKCLMVHVSLFLKDTSELINKKIKSPFSCQFIQPINEINFDKSY